MKENTTVIPTHVTIIMDGNGRWAKARGLDRVCGHREGAESVRECCRQAVASGVKYLSLFAFSEENWGRPDAEVSALMDLMLSSLVNEKPLFMDNDIAFRVVGDRSRLSREMREGIASLEEATRGHSRMTLVIFFNYSGMWDILQAAGRYARDYASGETDGPLGREVFASYLATAGIPDPDLMIRTSGEKRLSNYMLWQCAYTEFYFTDVFWPDFRKEEWNLAMEAYSNRDRRYGKVK